MSETKIPIQWKTEKRKISDLKEYAHNPRKMPKRMFEQLKSSITDIGYAELVAIDTDNTIIAGHMRVAAMKALGRENDEIEVRVPERKLTEDEFKRYLIVSNKVKGNFDNDMLANVFDTQFLVDFCGFLPSDFTDDDEPEPKLCPHCGKDINEDAD